MAKDRELSSEDARKLAEGLARAYEGVRYYLSFSTPIDLVVAAIISAQTRDETVNKLTPALFSKYKTAEDYANADENELINYIKSVSFAGNKAKNIINTCKAIEERYKGKVPNRMEALVELPGIGRKTANTILINAYGIVEGIPVDTWVIRLSYRLGLSLQKNQDKIEQDLMRKIPKSLWHNFAYVLKAHGKSICGTLPYCSKCSVNDICPKNGVVAKQ
jgi:endonuclease-3